MTAQKIAQIMIVKNFNSDWQHLIFVFMQFLTFRKQKCHFKVFLKRILLKQELFRQRYVKLAKELNVQCRCFVMNTSYEHAQHNNAFRLLIGTDKAHKGVNTMVMNVFRKNFTVYQKFSQ